MPHKVKDIPACKGCPLQRKLPDNIYVPPKMGKGSHLVVGESPSEDDVKNGVPLSDGAGRWFDSMCRHAGIKKDDLTIINVINCHPPDGVFPTDEETITHCMAKHVEPLVGGYQWKRITLLGDKPLKHLAHKSEGMMKWRGAPVAVPATGHVKPIAVGTLDPSYIMRDQSMLPVAINDLIKDVSNIPPENYDLFPDLDIVKAFKSKKFAFDIETNGWSREITMVGLCPQPTWVIIVPFRGPYVAELKRIFSEATEVIGHNSIQFDLPVLKDSGVEVSKDCMLWDTMLMQHLVFPSLPHDLEFTGSQFSNKPAWKDEKKIFQLYCARDVDVTMQAFVQLKDMLVQNNLMSLYRDVQVPLAKICHLMQITGFMVDSTKIGEMREKLTRQTVEEEVFLPAELRTREVPVKRRQPAPPGTVSPKTKKPLKFIMTDAMETIVPWRSVDNKKAFLYGTTEAWQLGFPEQIDIKTKKVTTGKVILERLQRKAAQDSKLLGRIPTAPRQLLALRNLNKWDELITTFCKKSMDSITKMHPHFNVHGTVSGRLSSSDPNLQNIPENARFLYVPSVKGWKILEVDYSGIENRLTAWFAGDKARLERFDSIPGFSEHKYAASKFLGIPYDEVEKSSDPDSDYIKAKKIVHSTNYGSGAKRIALANDLDFKDVKAKLDIWKAEIKATTIWQGRIAEQAKQQGYLETPFNRRGWFYTSNYYTESLSFLPQSTAADVIYRAMIGLMYQRIGLSEEAARRVVGIIEPIPTNSTLLIQVHDSLIFEYAPQVEETLILTVKKVMEQPWKELGGMSLPIGIKTGPSWGEVEDYHFSAR